MKTSVHKSNTKIFKRPIACITSSEIFKDTKKKKKIKKDEKKKKKKEKLAHKVYENMFPTSCILPHP